MDEAEFQIYKMKVLYQVVVKLANVQSVHFTLELCSTIYMPLHTEVKIGYDNGICQTGRHVY